MGAKGKGNILRDVLRYLNNTAKSPPADEKGNSVRALDVYAAMALVLIAFRYDYNDGDNGFCYGAQETLAKLARMSVNKFSTCLSTLKKLGLVTFHRHIRLVKAGGIEKEYKNVYQLNLAMIRKGGDTQTTPHNMGDDTPQYGEKDPTIWGETPHNMGSDTPQYGDKYIVKECYSKDTTTTTTKEDMKDPNSSRAVMIRRLIAQRLGTPVENVWPASVTKYALDKDPAKIVECVDEIRQMRNKDRDKLAKDPELHIALLFKKIEYLPSTSNAATDESYEQAFAQPEKVEKLEDMDLEYLEKRVRTIIREKFGIDKESPCYEECVQKCGAYFGNLDGRARRRALLKFIPLLEEAWVALTQAHPKPTHEESTETLRKVLEEYESGNR